MEYQAYAEKSVEGQAAAHSKSSDAAINEVLNDLVKKHDFCANPGHSLEESGKTGSGPDKSVTDMKGQPGLKGEVDKGSGSEPSDIVKKKTDGSNHHDKGSEGNITPKQDGGIVTDKGSKGPLNFQKPDVGGSTLEKEIMDRSKMLKSWSLKV